MRKMAMAAVAALLLAGCSSSVSRDRATMMGVVAGAGAGAVVGAAATGTATGTAVGAAVGGATGGIVTNALTPSRCYARNRHGRRYRVPCY